MNEEERLRQQYGKKNPFKVPDGYFERLTDTVMSRLPETEPKVQPPVSVWEKVRPWLYMAAMFVGLMFTIRMFMGKYSQADSQSPNPAIPCNISEIPDEYIEPIVDQTMMDDYQLYEYLSDANYPVTN